MADTVRVDYLYPPNMLDGDWDEKQGNRRVVVKLSGESDGTGESDVVKIDLSDLKTLNGNVPTRTAIEKIEYSVWGMICKLEWDRAPHKVIYIMNDSEGVISWERIGGFVDPGGDDRTGDILLTTTSGAAGDTYEITLTIRLKD